MKQKFYITGMTCSACSAFIDKTINKLDGVENASVSLVTNTMIVEYDDQVCSKKIIIEKVKEIGYGASIEKEVVKTHNTPKIKLIISIVFLLLLMYVSMGHMLGLPIPHFLHKPSLDNLLSGFYLGLIQLSLVLPIIVLNFGYFTRGIKHLIKFNPNMDTLIAIGAFASIVYGITTIIWSYLGYLNNDLEAVTRLYEQYYFESAGSILTFVSVGKYFEGTSKKKTTEAISKLINLTPEEVLIKKDDKYELISVKEVVVDSVIMVKPGQMIALDGIIIEGETSINTASLTGESMPVYKKNGDTVLAGTLNLSGTIIVKVTHAYEDSSVAKIVKLVEEASNSKMPISRLVDKVARIFVPVVIFLSIITAIVWLFIDKNAVFNHTISVLVISCPCALGLATPLGIMVSSGTAATRGILIRNSVCMEILKDVNTVVFDKTGTLTEGKMTVKEIININSDYQDLVNIAYNVEKNSNHPLANSICENLEKAFNINYEFDSIKELPGFGMICKYNQDTYYVGNSRLLTDNEIIVPKEIEELSYTKILIGKNNQILGAITFEDTVKKQSSLLIETLKNMNIKTVLLSGDNAKTANKLQKELGIDECYAEALPEDKKNVIVNLQKHGKVLMVGDGINDAVALTTADVGIAIGDGTDIAIDSADIIIIGQELIHIVEAINISRKTIDIIKMNLFWAFFYNSICIPVAAGILVPLGITISPMIGSLMMSLSSICVVLNSLRLKRIKKIENTKGEKEVIKKVIFVEGMMCKHCQKHVEDALTNTVGVNSVVVDLESKTATVEINESVTEEVLKKAIIDAGYEVIEIK